MFLRQIRLFSLVKNTSLYNTLDTLVHIKTRLNTFSLSPGPICSPFQATVIAELDLNKNLGKIIKDGGRKLLVGYYWNVEC